MAYTYSCYCKRFILPELAILLYSVAPIVLTTKHFKKRKKILNLFYTLSSVKSWYYRFRTALVIFATNYWMNLFANLGVVFSMLISYPVLWDFDPFSLLEVMIPKVWFVFSWVPDLLRAEEERSFTLLCACFLLGSWSQQWKMPCGSRCLLWAEQQRTEAGLAVDQQHIYPVLYLWVCFPISSLNTLIYILIYTLLVLVSTQSSATECRLYRQTSK